MLHSIYFISPLVVLIMPACILSMHGLAPAPAPVIPVHIPIPPMAHLAQLNKIPVNMFGINAEAMAPQAAPPPFVKPSRKLEYFEEQEEGEDSGQIVVEGRKLTGDLQPVSYQTKIIIQNSTGQKLMPGFRTTDLRYKELNNPIPNIPNGQQWAMEVPYDIHEVIIWPRINCDDQGFHCQSGQCNDGMHCNGQGPTSGSPALDEVHLNLRDGKNLYSAPDHYKAVPYSHENAFHVTMSRPGCPTLDVRGNPHHYECQNTDLAEHTYTLNFAPL